MTGDLIPKSYTAARDLPSEVLYALERAGEISRRILDDRVTGWVAEGWTQQRIADELGCSQPAVSMRMARLGIAPAQPTKPRRYKPLISPPATNGHTPDVIEDVTDFDPTTEVVCPTCHGLGWVPVHEPEGVNR